MRKISADWIFPVSSLPLKNGVIIVDDAGKIIALDAIKNFDEAELEIYTGIICPGFINAHCHLEGSYMKGKIPEHTGLIGFVTEFIKNRDDNHPSVQPAIEAADHEMRENGIVGVGDISNGSASFRVKSNSEIRYHTFVECFGLQSEKANDYFGESRKIFDLANELNFHASITPHAPYSVTDELFRLIFSFDRNNPPLFSYHNQETMEENKWARNEPNAFDQLYLNLKVPRISRNGESSLKAHLKFFSADRKLLLVHNTCSSSEDFHFATDRMNSNVFFCTCPNANLYIENRLPDYSFWKSYPDQICIGTDSLASNHQLSVLEEMKTIQKHDPQISFALLIQWATLNGARFFDWDAQLGSLDEGKMPGIILITGSDPETFRLSSHARVQRLV